MESEDESDTSSVIHVKVDQPQKRRRVKRIKIPRREPSVIIPPRKVRYITPDKTVCDECICFPKEDPYSKNKKLHQCQASPLTLYELAAAVVDRLPYPDAFEWSVEAVADWMEDVVGLPQYRACILDNHIDGRRLLRLEDPSVLPEINIHNFDHIKMVTAEARKLFSMDYVRFVRSIGLPFRYPLTYCTWFKSLTGPSWGIRTNWTRSDVLRWMQMIMPEPLHLDHWDLVWYEKPDFPKVMFASIPKAPVIKLPKYEPTLEFCNEYETPRRFRLFKNLPEEAQLIWMEHRPGSASYKEKKAPPKKKVKLQHKSRILPPPVDLSGLSGKELIMARRKAPKPKFLARETKTIKPVKAN